MNVVGLIVDIVLKVIKFFFGTDKPKTEGVTNEKPSKPIGEPSDDDILADLGLRVEHRSTGCDGICNCESGQASADHGKQEHKS